MSEEEEAPNLLAGVTKYYTRWLMPKDIDELTLFAIPPIGQDELEQVIELGNEQCRVARGHPGDLRGYIVWRTYHANAHILSVTVHPDHRRRGIAKALLGDIIIRTPHNISLEVRDDNEAAKRLYASLEFEYQGRYLRYYGEIDALIYAHKGAG